ncbi:MAG: class I SAM-dependent methyltransferase [Acidobacteria bacterium]|nr:class I SAM-dependent methyltransferase [Acidobacteriota bacterium]
MPSDEELGLLYGEEFYQKPASQALSFDYVRSFVYRLWAGQRRGALLGRTAGKALDVGCGDGEFLASLKSNQWDTYGLEFSAAACALARSKGINVEQVDLINSDFPSYFFDVVTMWHVLEHLSDPLSALHKAKKILKDDGLLVIEVPNSDCLTFHLFKTHWTPLGIPWHFQHFTPKTLSSILSTAGFTVTRRQNFHLFDFVLTFSSLMNWLDILKRQETSNPNGHSLFADFSQAGNTRKLFFMALGIALLPVCLLYLTITVLLTGNSETVTLTCQKVSGEITESEKTR